MLQHLRRHCELARLHREDQQLGAALLIPPHTNVQWDVQRDERIPVQNRAPMRVSMVPVREGAFDAAFGAGGATNSYRQRPYPTHPDLQQPRASDQHGLEAHVHETGMYYDNEPYADDPSGSTLNQPTAPPNSLAGTWSQSISPVDRLSELEERITAIEACVERAVSARDQSHDYILNHLISFQDHNAKLYEYLVRMQADILANTSQFESDFLFAQVDFLTGRNADLQFEVAALRNNLEEKQEALEAEQISSREKLQKLSRIVRKNDDKYAQNEEIREKVLSSMQESLAKTRAALNDLREDVDSFQEAVVNLEVISSSSGSDSCDSESESIADSTPPASITQPETGNVGEEESAQPQQQANDMSEPHAGTPVETQVEAPKRNLQARVESEDRGPGHSDDSEDYNDVPGRTKQAYPDEKAKDEPIIEV